MAPEYKRKIMEGNIKLDYEKCDVYSLGLTILNAHGKDIKGLNGGDFEKTQHIIR